MTEQARPKTLSEIKIAYEEYDKGFKDGGLFIIDIFSKACELARKEEKQKVFRKIYGLIVTTIGIIILIALVVTYFSEHL